MQYIAISGGFDPLHSGHIAYIDAASQYGNVVVFLNTDEWLMRKKGFVFMPWHERAIIMRKLRGVSRVVMAKDDDGTVCESIRSFGRSIKYFGNGGDRGPKNTPEDIMCNHMGIKLVYGLGGGKTQSSTWLVQNVQKGGKELGSLS